MIAAGALALGRSRSRPTTSSTTRPSRCATTARDGEPRRSPVAGSSPARSRSNRTQRDARARRERRSGCRSTPMPIRSRSSSRAWRSSSSPTAAAASTRSCAAGSARTTRARSRSAGLIQMFETEPERHIVFARGLDTDRDGMFSRAEVDDSVIALLVVADIQLFDGERYAPRPDSDNARFAVGRLSRPPARRARAGGCTTAVPVERLPRSSCATATRPTSIAAARVSHARRRTRVRAAEDCQSGACDAGTVPRGELQRRGARRLRERHRLRRRVRDVRGRQGVRRRRRLRVGRVRPERRRARHVLAGLLAPRLVDDARGASRRTARATAQPRPNAARWSARRAIGATSAASRSRSIMP